MHTIRTSYLGEEGMMMSVNYLYIFHLSVDYRYTLLVSSIIRPLVAKHRQETEALPHSPSFCPPWTVSVVSAAVVLGAGFFLLTPARIMAIP